MKPYILYVTSNKSDCRSASLAELEKNIADAKAQGWLCQGEPFIGADAAFYQFMILPKPSPAQ